MRLAPRPSTRHRAAAVAVATMAAALGAAASLTGAGAAWNAGGKLPSLTGGRIWSVAASPATAGTVVAGTDRGVYTSLDSGKTWSGPSLAGTRVWTVGWDVRNPDHLFAGTDGSGVEMSSDGGSTWQNTSAGLGNRVVRSFGFGLDGIAAGTDSGVWLSPDGTAWHAGGLSGDSVSTLAVAANSPQLVLLAGIDAGPDLASGYMFRSNGNSLAWQNLQSGLPSNAVASALSAGPLTSSVTKRPLVAATTKGIYRSGDSGDTWTAATGIADTLTATTVVVSPLDPALVYAGADAGGASGGDLWRSTDGGGTFAVADQGLPTSTREVESIAVAQTTPPTLVAALDPAAGGLVFSEVDGSAPSPPQLVAESPGAAIPAILATAPPTPTPRPSLAPSATPAPATGLAALAGTAFHFPGPRLLWVLAILVAVYGAVRWRQRYYIEGPP
ncbi:MAG: WD40/YVTN/BNR-like repeat-containing protein [Candidatus Dormibacteria bacterium]